MNLPGFLCSKDIETRNRATASLSSFLVTHPLLILERFTEYCPFFQNLLQNRQEESISFQSINALLANAIVAVGPQLKSYSIIAILKYICQYLDIDSPQEDSQVNYFAMNMMSPNMFIEGIVLLFQNQIDAQFYPYLIRIVSITESPKIIKLLQPHLQEIVQNLKYDSIPFLIRSLYAPDQNLVTLSAQVLLKSASNQKIMTTLFPYLTIIASAAATLKSKDLAQLCQLIEKADPVRQTSSQLNAAGQLRSIVYEEPMFRDCIPSNALRQFGQKIFQNVSNQIQRSSVLKKRISIPLSSLVETSESNPKLSARVHADLSEIKEELKGYARKLGGATKTAFQTRYFEFYIQNRCLIWRNNATPGDIKGLLFIDGSIKVSVNGTSILLETPKKVHHISFDPAANVPSPRADFAEWSKELVGASKRIK